MRTLRRTTLRRRRHRRRTIGGRRRRSTQRRRNTRRYRGGYGPGGSPIGSPYTAGNSNSWPGVSGNAAGSGNWIAGSPIGIPSGRLIPPEPTNQRGGSSIFTDITNVGREIGSALSHFGSTLQGVIPPVSTFPSVKHQPIGLQSNAVITTRMPPNIPKIHQQVGQYVAGI